MAKKRKRTWGWLEEVRASARRFQKQYPDVVKYGVLTAAVLFVIVCLATGYYYVAL